MDNDYLHRRLITLGDMIGDGLHYEDSAIAREYRKITKLLYPEMFPRKAISYTNKPSKAMMKTIKLCPCGLKQFGWERKDNLVRLFCECGRDTGFHSKNSLARDVWNKGIEDNK